MMILMVLLDCRLRVNCAKHVEPYPVSLHHSYDEVHTCLVYWTLQLLVPGRHLG